MAEITLLTPEQVAEREQKPKGQRRSGRRRSAERTRIIEEFKSVLQQAQPGYGGDVLLNEGEEKRVVRQNLKAAADALQQALAFRPVRDKNRMHFRVSTLEEQAAKPPRGRPRRTSVEEQAQTVEEAQAPQHVAVDEPTGSPVRRRRPSSRTRQGS